MREITLPNRSTFIIREYRVEDMFRVLALWKVAFGKEMSVPLWQWKYHDNPFGYRMMLCVNEADEPVVTYGGVPYQANWNGKTIEIIHLMDIMSHPDYRKTGLFINTIEAFIDRFTGPDRSVLLYGFPSQYHFDIGQKYMAYKKILPGVAYLRAMLSCLIGHVPEPEGSMERILEADDTLDSLWETVKPDYPFSLQRDSLFIHWRYDKHPIHGYELWGYRSKLQDSMLAYVVLKVDSGKAAIVDLLTPDSQVVVGNVLGKLAQMLSVRGVEQLETWLPGGHFLSQYAMLCGFANLPEPMGIVPTARIFHPSITFEWLYEHMYYTMADGDLM
jgi:hypothetical protein